MKTPTVSYRLILFTALLMFTAATYGQQKEGSIQKKDPVKKANKENEKKAAKSIVDDKVADFLVKAADARIMGIKEGELAEKNGTTKDIRDYGKLMVSDQGKMLTTIRAIAAKKNITLPKDIGADKQDGYKQLAEKSGTDFDKKFMKMMAIDHKRDIRQFKKAGKYDDIEVSSFTSGQLPLIKEHLAKLKALKH